MHSRVITLMSKAWSEGDVVALYSKGKINDYGFILKFHRRGECELDPGLALLSSGRFIPLTSYWAKTIEGSSLALFQADDVSAETPEEVRRFLNRNSRSIKKRGRPRLARIEEILSVTREHFYKWGSCERGPFLGKLNLPRSFSSLKAFFGEIEHQSFIMKRRKNYEILNDNSTSITQALTNALKGESEGFWMNPCVSVACIKYLGVPAEYFRTGRSLVSEYNQLIIQVDGSDSARTLGMHKDRDSEDREVNTILGCVAGDGGKELIIWKNSCAGDMPRWWRYEGLGREAFELAKIQCFHSPEIGKDADLVTLEPGDYIFMPKGTWHWACPSGETRWTVMVTSSFY